MSVRLAAVRERPSSGANTNKSLGKDRDNMITKMIENVQTEEAVFKRRESLKEHHQKYFRRKGRLGRWLFVNETVNEKKSQENKDRFKNMITTGNPKLVFLPKSEENKQRGAWKRMRVHVNYTRYEEIVGHNGRTTEAHKGDCQYKNGNKG